MDRRISYADNREDIILSGFFPTVVHGFYIDASAGHPTLGSITKYFYENGWQGVDVAPDVALRKLLIADRPQDVILGSISGLPDEFSKIADRHINFLRCDPTEFDLSVLFGDSEARLRPEVICAAVHDESTDWRKLLLSQKYSLAFFDGVNEYYVAEESAERQANFSYSQTILEGPVIVSYPVMCEQRRLEQKLASLTLQNEELATELKQVKAELGGLAGGIGRNAVALLKSFDVAIATRLHDKSAAGPDKLDLTTPQTGSAISSVAHMREQYLINYIHRPKRTVAKAARRGYTAVRLIGRQVKRAVRKRHDEA